MMQSHSSATAACRVAWEGTVSGKAEVPSRFSCEPAWLGFALLCSLPPTPSLSVQAVRTVTAPAGADLNFTWEVKCWLWQRERFSHCAAAKQLPFPLSRGSSSQTKPSTVVVTKPEFWKLKPSWLLSSPTVLSLGYLKFLLELLTISVRWLWPWWVALFSREMSSSELQTQQSDWWLFLSCCRDWWMHLVCCGHPIPVMCKVWADVGCENNITCVWLTLLFIHQNILEKSGQAFKCWSLFKAFWIS